MEILEVSVCQGQDNPSPVVKALVEGWQKKANPSWVLSSSGKCLTQNVSGGICLSWCVTFFTGLSKRRWQQLRLLALYFGFWGHVPHPNPATWTPLSFIWHQISAQPNRDTMSDWWETKYWENLQSLVKILQRIYLTYFFCSFSHLLLSDTVEEF